MLPYANINFFACKIDFLSTCMELPGSSDSSIVPIRFYTNSVTLVLHVYLCLCLCLCLCVFLYLLFVYLFVFSRMCEDELLLEMARDKDPLVKWTVSRHSDKQKKISSIGTIQIYLIHSLCLFSLSLSLFLTSIISVLHLSLSLFFACLSFSVIINSF